MSRSVRPLSPRRILIACGGLLLLTALAPSARAQVMDPTFPVVNAVNGHVFLLGDTLYVGGSFNWAAPRNGSCVALDAATGQPVTPWPSVQADLMDGLWTRIAAAAVSDGAGGCFVAGSFDSISGVPRFRLAHIRGDGTLDAWSPRVPASWYPQCIARADSVLYVGGSFEDGSDFRPLLGAIDIRSGSVLWTAASAGGQVLVLANHGATLYAGGSFTSLGGQTRSNLAAIDPRTGLATSWNPGADNAVVALTVSDSAIFAGGSFANIGGAARGGVAALDPETGAATSWSVSLGLPSVLCLALTGTTLYIGGQFYSINGQARGPLGAIDTRTAQPLPWNPISANFANSIATDGKTVYASGVFWPESSTPPVILLAAFDAVTGAMEPWSINADQQPSGLALGNGRLFVVGAAACGGLPRLHAAAVDLTSGRLTDWDPHPDQPIASFASDGATLFVGGYFTQIAGQPRNGIAAFDRSTGALLPWNPAYGKTVVQVQHMALRGRTLYVDGWAGSVGASSVLAAIDVDSGTQLWTATVTGASYFQVNGLFTLGAKVFVLGDFYAVNGVSRRSAAAVDALSGVLTSWDPQLTGWCSSGVPYAGTVYLCGGISAAAGQPVYEGAVFDSTSGTLLNVPTPVPDLGFPNSLFIDGSTLYAGGQSAADDPYPHEMTEARAFDMNTGSALPWYVGIQRVSMFGGALGVISIAARSGEVWLAGDFDTAWNETRCGLAHVLPADGIPPVVSVDAPSGTPLRFASTHSLSWTAAGAQRVLSADLYLSRSGPAGPWELLAGGIEGVSAYPWTVTGPASADCRLRVDARDLAGDQGSATSAMAFAIADTAAAAGVGSQAAPTRFALAAPVPTPTSGPATIAYELAARSRVRLSLFDVQGREVAVLERGEREAGRRVATIDTRGLRAGLYLVHLRAGSVELHRRLIVVH